MDDIIPPKILKGFRDSLPDTESAKSRLVRCLERTFELFGFVPIDTPVLEYSEVLLGKAGGETEKQVYRFLDHGGRDVSLRYDLTVPFARFMAAHRSELYLPFKRYHIAKVWRGENTQRGRYREFIQCDFDIVGTDSFSSDFEILLLMVRALEALDIREFHIHYSHRGLFNRLLERLGIADRGTEILRTIDKLSKIGQAEVREMMRSFAENEAVDAILDFGRREESFEKTLSKLRDTLGGDSQETLRLERIRRLMEEMDLADFFILDPSITRGLDYYTGIVFETFLDRNPGLGSVCSGGRYDNLTSLYTTESMPGVGSSIGLDRLFSAMEDLGLVQSNDLHRGLLILCLDENLLGYYHRTASVIRAAGIRVDVYPEKKKLARQFQFAEKKGIPFALICGEEEIKNETYTLKNLNTRESFSDLKVKDLVEMLLTQAPISPNQT